MFRRKSYLIITFLFALFALSGQAQSFKGETVEFYDAVEKWVTIEHDDGSFTYSFVYLDAQAGFSAKLGGSYSFNQDNELVKKPQDTSYSVRIRLPENPAPLTLLSDFGIKQLDLQPIPSWLSYYRDTTIEYLTAMGYHFNHVGASKKALDYLEKAYKISKNNPATIFELSYSYNALKRYDDAQKILQLAVQKDPENSLFLKELTYALCKNKKLYEAETYGNQALAVKNGKYKSEIAFNIAQQYYLLKSYDKFREWKMKSLKHKPGDPRIVKYLESMEKQISNK